MTLSSLRRFFYHSTDLELPIQPLHTYAIGDELLLPDGVLHHWGRVLRATTDERGILFDGYGSETVVEIREIGKKHGKVVVIEHNYINRQADIQVTVALVMSRGERSDYAIQKATELGATHIQLLSSQHGEVNLKATQIDKKLNHWQQVAFSACEQCGLNYPPLVHAPLKMIDWLTRQDNYNHLAQNDLVPSLADIAKQTYYQSTNLVAIDGPPPVPALKLILTVPNQDKTEPVDVQQYILQRMQLFNQLNVDYPNNQNDNYNINDNNDHNNPISLKNDAQTANEYQRMSIEILIGPEGGFSDSEHQMAENAGYIAWQLGTRVLRAETAPVVALSTLHCLHQISLSLPNLDFA